MKQEEDFLKQYEKKQNIYKLERINRYKSEKRNEAHFGLLRNARNFQKLNRTGMKNAEKELTIRSIAHNIQKIHEKLNATLI